MADIFVKKTWTDRISEFITRRTLTKEDGSTEIVTVERNEGEVSQEGDAFDANTMNDLEDRIYSGFEQLNNDLTEYCKVINGKLFAFNSETQLFDKEIKMGLPTLDYSKPLFSFNATNLSYTATKECYLVGTWTSNSVNQPMTINGQKMFYTSNDTVSNIFVKLSAGDVVSVPNVKTSAVDCLKVLAEK